MTNASRNKHRRLIAFFCFVFIAGSVFGIALPALRRAKCGAQALKSGMVLKQLSYMVFQEIEETGTLPARLAVLCVETGTMSRDSYPRCLPTIETLVGPYQLEDAFAGLVSYSDLEGAAANDPAVGEWERIGRFMLSREIPAYRSLRHDVIIGYQLGNYGYMKDGWFGHTSIGPFNTNIAFADNHVSLYRIDGSEWDDFEEVVEADRAARVELGLSEPPDYTSVIRAFMRGQEKR